jgi:Pentapeptide repeats (8 copies)
MAALTIEQRPIRWHSVWTVLVGVFWVAIVVGIIGGFFLHWDWTGFRDNGKLWDWLQLLSAPVFVLALPFLFRGQRNQADLQVADDQKQEAALQAYQEYICTLLLDKNLSGSQPGSEVREVARARTLAALRRVGNNRKGDVLRFLHESGLIYTGKAIVDLRESDLSGADLSNAKLSGSNLAGADLSNAKLSGADLKWADLSNVKLSGADLSGADLSNADMNGATYTMEQLSKTHSFRNEQIS